MTLQAAYLTGGEAACPLGQRITYDPLWIDLFDFVNNPQAQTTRWERSSHRRNDRSRR
jgi:hypothetical protein